MVSISGHVMASGDHGSSSTVPVISAIKEAGLRNEIPAHTPSPLSPAPRTCDSRWLSHRSTPRAGTRTNSSANGSGRGLASSVPSPPTSRSVRSARWTWSAIESHPRTDVDGDGGIGDLSYERTKRPINQLGSLIRQAFALGVGELGHGCGRVSHLGVPVAADVLGHRQQRVARLTPGIGDGLSVLDT